MSGVRQTATHGVREKYRSKKDKNLEAKGRWVDFN